MSQEFKKHLKMAIVLLGGNDELLSIIDNEDNEHSITQLQNWCALRTDQIKDKLVELKKQLNYCA